MNVYICILFTSIATFMVNSINAQSFIKITEGDIVKDKATSQSCSWGDFNNDGFLDLFIANYATNNFLYKNKGDGTFEKITEGDVVNDVGNSAGSCWGDYDNDGDLDLFVSNQDNQNNFLYKNTGVFNHFELIRIENGDIVTDRGDSYCCSWGDYDNDGNLDLFVANWKSDNNFLYHNNGPPDYVFTKIDTGDIVIVVDGEKSVGCNWIDYNNDGWLDLFVVNGYHKDDSWLKPTNNFLFKNSGPPYYTLKKISYGNIVNDLTISRGGSWGDYDNDGDLDLFLANEYYSRNMDFLYQNSGFPEYTFTKILIDNDNWDSAGSSWSDYDNDGDLDLFVTNWYSYVLSPTISHLNNRLYRNSGPPNYTFVKDTIQIISNDDGYSMGCGWSDVNNDGYLDLFVANWDTSQNNFFYHNNGNENNWINIQLKGTASNSSAIGAKVYINTTMNDSQLCQMREISTQTGFFSQNSLNAEFGLGNSNTIDSLIVKWPSGIVWDTTNVAVNQFLTIMEFASPVAITDTVSNVDTSSAILHARVNPNGLTTNVFFEWGKDITTENKVTGDTLDGINLIPVSIQLSDLEYATEYHYRITAVNKVDKTEGQVKTFITGGKAPKIVEVCPKNINKNFALLRIKIKPNGLTTSVKCQYGETMDCNNEKSAMRSLESGLEDTVSVKLTALMSGEDYYYRIIAKNDSGLDTSSVQSFKTYTSNYILSDTIEFKYFSNADDYQSTDYRLLGLPGCGLFGIDELFPANSKPGKDWQVYYDDGSASNFLIKYRSSDSRFNFSEEQVGRAFWIINKGDLSINLNVKTAELNDKQKVEIPLNKGWNLITNPFDTTIEWSKIKIVNDSLVEPIWSFSDTFSQSLDFEPYIGYYFYNKEASILKIPYAIIFSDSCDSSIPDTTLWKVRLIFSSEDFVDKTLSFGVSKKASKELDPFDFRKPRNIGKIPEIIFNRPHWDKNYSIFTTDIRADVEEMENWEFEVWNTHQQSSQLLFKGVDKIPNHLDVYLVDDEKRKYVNLRKRNNYNFVGIDDIMKFHVIVGKSASIQKQLRKINLPEQFLLEYSYPNPFNISTTIPISIPGTFDISLKIFNLLGQKVKTIYEGQIEAGCYKFIWDGNDESNIEIASGVYVLHLCTSTGITLTNKMVLMK